MFKASSGLHGRGLVVVRLGEVVMSYLMFDPP